MAAVDQADSAAYDVDDILEPSGWTLLNFLMDSRTGLGRFREFRISNYELMMSLIDACIRHETVEEILALPDVAERVRALPRPEPTSSSTQLRRVSTRAAATSSCVDLREEETIHAGNRFMVYALFPECRVSVHVIWGREAPEHRARRRTVDHRPLLDGRHRRGDARATAAAATPPRAPARCRTPRPHRVLGEVIDAVAAPMVAA